jgi:hypothetical protein
MCWGYSSNQPAWWRSLKLIEEKAMHWYLSNQFIDSLIADFFDEFDGFDAATDAAISRRPATARIGSYRQVGGHHIHQSASYAPRRGVNPHHNEAITIAHGMGFSRVQHRRADSVQRRINRGLHGLHSRDDPTNPLRVTATGSGRLQPTANPWLEDVKAYYSLRAARPAGYDQPQTALELVERSARDLQRSGIRPQRVPRHGR